jgi:cytochrome P450
LSTKPNSGDADKHAILEEILRLEPVVSTLFRDSGGQRFSLDVRSANLDEQFFGADPKQIDLDRARQPRVPASGLAFGDGEHRCPGANIALHETAIFLDRLLRMPGLRLQHAPKLGWNDQVKGYELRGCRLILEGTD